MSSAAISAMLKRYRRKVNNQVSDVLAEVIIEVMTEKGLHDDELKDFLEKEKDIEELKFYLKAVSMANNREELMEYVEKKGIQ